MILSRHFARIYAISLPYREDRRARLRAQLQRETITMLDAHPGDDLPPPAAWRGNGSWGCLMSHTEALRRAWRELESDTAAALILEDDVVWLPRARRKARLARFMAALPERWGQLYLGGQHLSHPCRVGAEAWRGTNINRTHAYAVQRWIIPQILAHLWHWPDYAERGGKVYHCDHQLGMAHTRGDWEAWCPPWWIAGQGEEAKGSNIAGNTHDELWWHWSGWSARLPFFLLDGTDPGGVWCGAHPEPDSLTDVGLAAAGLDAMKLGKWLGDIARESLDRNRLPAAQVPADLDRAQWRAMARPMWGAGIFDLRTEEGRAALEGWRDYPERLAP